MKKFLTGILSLALTAAMSVPAFAADNSATNTGGSTSIPVSGNYQATTEPDVISVDLVWDAMDFTYTAPSKGTWNPEKHKYEGGNSGGWEATSGTNPEITVTNHSNVEVKASFAFNSDIQDLFPMFSSETLVVDSAVGTDPADAPKDKISFYVYGNDATIDADQKLGTVTVTITKFDSTPQMISTAEELLATKNQTGVFKLANDIDIGGGIIFDSGKYVLDLNGHTLSGKASMDLIKIYGNATIKNGHVVNNTDDEYGKAISTYSNAKFTLENCVLTAPGMSLGVYGTTAYITDSEFHTTTRPTAFTILNCTTMTLSGDVKVIGGAGFSNQGDTVTALPGTYNFDVSSYVDTALYDVTNDGTTWTVTAK